MLELRIGRTHPEVRGQRKSINANPIGPLPGHCLPAVPHPRVGGWTEKAGGRSEMKKQDGRRYTQNGHDKVCRLILWTLESHWGVLSKGILFFLQDFFFWCGPFLKSLLNVLQYCFCFMFWFCGLESCGILAL